MHASQQKRFDWSTNKGGTNRRNYFGQACLLAASVALLPQCGAMTVSGPSNHPFGMAQTDAATVVSQLTSSFANAQNDNQYIAPVLSPCVQNLQFIFAKEKLDADPAKVASDFVNNFCLSESSYVPGKNFPDFSS